MAQRQAVKSGAANSIALFQQCFGQQLKHAARRTCIPDFRLLRIGSIQMSRRLFFLLFQRTDRTAFSAIYTMSGINLGIPKAIPAYNRRYAALRAGIRTCHTAGTPQMQILDPVNPHYLPILSRIMVELMPSVCGRNTTSTPILAKSAAIWSYMLLPFQSLP